MQKLPRIPNGVKRETHTIDATDKVLGRLAAQIAVLLRGKHRPNTLSVASIV